MQLSSITSWAAGQQQYTQQSLSSLSVKAQQSAKAAALIIETHLKSDVKDNSSTPASLSSV